MNEKIAALLNQQINKEFYSAYLYLDMARDAQHFCCEALCLCLYQWFF